MEIIRSESIARVEEAGVELKHLLYPANSASERIILTQVTVAPGVVNERHAHETLEQAWFALEGHGLLLIDDDKTLEFRAGDVARFADGEVHGFHNTGATPFVYLSVTSPSVRPKAA